MSFLEYIKEKWWTLIVGLCLFVFSYAVYRLDQNLMMSESSATYIFMTLIIGGVVFIVIDYFLLNNRINKMKETINNNLDLMEIDSFSYPVDRIYADTVKEINDTYVQYRGKIQEQSFDEQEFITKWIHDVKVPIAAIRMVLDCHEHDISDDFYRMMDSEIASIEQKTQTVFYHIKSQTIYEDYKIKEVSSKKMISYALKAYASFFTYKKINLTISGDDYKVVTDDKYAEYVISQIISNAVKYTPENGAININTCKTEKAVQITIENKGLGIKLSELPFVFNKGYTMDEYRNSSKSTGYGMYLSKKLCNILNHELSVSSVYGESATFTLTFFDYHLDVTKV